MRRRTRAILAAAAAATVVGLAGGTAAAVASTGQAPTPPPVTAGSWDMNAMHNSPAMQEMRSRMPADVQANCDKMHDQMGAGMGQMMGVQR